MNDHAINLDNALLSGFKTLQDFPLGILLLPPRSEAKGQGVHSWSYEETLHRIQRFRSSIAVSEGTVSLEALDYLRQPGSSQDAESYHILMTHSDGVIAACVRLQLRPSGSSASCLSMFGAIRRMPGFTGLNYSSAMNQAIYSGRNRGLSVAELSDWAVVSDRFHDLCTLLLPLTAVALLKLKGHAQVFAYVPEGVIIPQYMGRHLVHMDKVLAPVFDSHYNGMMEVLEIDSQNITSEYAPLIEELTQALMSSSFNITAAAENVSETSISTYRL